MLARISSTSSLLCISNFLLFLPTNLASNSFLDFSSNNFAIIFQYSSGIKSSISFSLSTISLTATDWTLPADNPFLTFFHNTGLILYPTILSNTRLACCALTKFISICLGSFIAFCTAVLVISLKVTLDLLSSGISKICAKCQAIASPSRSGSVAKYTFLADFASFFNDFIKSPFPLMFMYSGSKLFSILTPNFDLGKSLICPIDATTLVFPPKNFFIVFAFAGDSTIINLSAIFFSFLVTEYVFCNL